MDQGRWGQIQLLSKPIETLETPVFHAASISVGSRPMLQIHMTHHQRKNSACTLRSLMFRIVLFGSVVSFSELTFAQGLISAPLNWGFEQTSSITATVDEMLGPFKSREDINEAILGPGYPALWMAEVQFKSVRHRLMEVVDPQSGESRLELVWYLVYRVIQRDYTELAGDSRIDLLKKLQDPDTQPQNAIDGVEGYPLQLPRFVLRTDDSEQSVEYVDEVNAEVQRAVFLRELEGRTEGLRLLSSVEAITEVVDPVSVNDPDPLSKAVYGVAIWRGVDPETDYFTITMTGFSNAYRYSKNAAGEGVFEQKVIEQRFARPGDPFKQTESEFRLIESARLDRNGTLQVTMGRTVVKFPEDEPSPRFVGELRAELQDELAAGRRPQKTWPIWKYQARPGRVTVNNFEAILRNAKANAPKNADAEN
jgi:hypothetical protein